MSANAFDTLSTARDLEAPALGRAQAEAIALAFGRTRDDAATKADLAPPATKAELAALGTRLTNRFHGVAVALAGVIVAGANLL